MSEKYLRRVHLVYAWVLAALILAVGVGFSLSCLAIYQSGDAPFTRENISIHFDRIAPLVYTCLVGVVGGWVLAFVWPCGVGVEDGTSAGKVKAVRDPVVLLKKQAKRLNMDAIPVEYRRKMERERALRRWLVVGTVTICVGIMMPALIRCLDAARFSVENLNGDIMAASRIILCCTAVALAVATVAMLLYGASVSREMAAVKTAVTELKGGAYRPSDGRDRKKKSLSDNAFFMWSIRGAILAAAVVFVVLGVLNGGMADVLGKAIRICTECIGLG